MKILILIINVITGLSYITIRLFTAFEVILMPISKKESKPKYCQIPVWLEFDTLSYHPATWRRNKLIQVVKFIL